METREFEPDPPILTPRISAMMTFDEGDFKYYMSILKSADDIWNNLDENNRISLYVRYIDLATGETENRLINKNK